MMVTDIAREVYNYDNDTGWSTQDPDLKEE